MAFKTFISDDGRLIIHVDEDFKQPGEISLDGASPFPFDPSVLVAIGEHYFDRALWLALDEVKFVVGDLYKLGDVELKEKVADLAANIRHLHELRRERLDQPQFKLRCTGCGMGYDPPLMNGFICAECSSVWDSVEEKWKLSEAAVLAQQAAKVGDAVPKEAEVSARAQAIIDVERVEMAQAYKNLHGKEPEKYDLLEHRFRKFVFNGTHFVLEEEGELPR